MEEGIPDGGTDRGLEDDATPSPTTPPPLDAGSGDEPFDCFDVSPSSPGVYTVPEAGTVEIDAVDEEVLVLVIAQGPSADDAHAVAEICTSLI